MKLIDALEILKQPIAADAPQLKVYLACGFTPVHLQTLLAAHLHLNFPQRRAEIATGLYGDLIGNLERLDPTSLNVLTVMIEWEDLDPRLGVRRLGGWRPSSLPDIDQSVEQAAARLQRIIEKLSAVITTVVCLPTLPLPPLSWTQPDRAASFELRLHQTVASLAAALAERSSAQIANAQRIGELSPPGQRYDLKSDIITGFPYSLSHAAVLAELLSRLIDYRPRKKGLITDLDDTLWAGILGEDGVSGISWSLEDHTQMHGLYQQFLASLAGAGVLIGVASKNDPALVGHAFNRSDLLISKGDIFPFEAHWSSKSESVKRILEAWNIGADSVVFIDDSPMEVAEVKAAFPEMECIVFPNGNYQGIWDLLKNLRSLFGKSLLTEEDSLRLNSIRNAGEWRDKVELSGDAPEDLLRSADASVTFSLTREAGDARAFELINKTNQFNLNGKRFSESEWRSFLSDPATFVLTVSYKDKFGPLGTIAALLGRTEGRMLHVNAWVMSCRAFSRRIEHQCLRHLFETLGVEQIAFDYVSTPRNGPLQEFFTQILGSSPTSGVRLSMEQFAVTAPPLYHHIEETINV